MLIREKSIFENILLEVVEKLKDFDISAIPYDVIMDDHIYDAIFLSMDKDSVKVSEWFYNLRSRLISKLESKKLKRPRLTVSAVLIKARIPKTKTMVSLRIKTKHKNSFCQSEKPELCLWLSNNRTKTIVLDMKEIENNIIERTLLRSRSRSDI